MAMKEEKQIHFNISLSSTTESLAL